MRRPALIALALVAAAAVTAGLLLVRGGTVSGTTEAAPPTSAAPATTTTVAVPTSTPPTTTAPPSTLAPGTTVCDRYSAVEVTGTVASTELVETSGIAFGRANPDVLWAHNDSRGGAVVFALARDGAEVGTFPVTSAFAFDWEDIAAGPGPVPDTPYLYIGDIGDNFAIRGGSVTVYRTIEPDLAAGEARLVAEPLDLRFPDGSPNAEAIFLDPADTALYVVTRDPDETRVYRADGAAAAGSSQDLEFVAAVDLGAHVTGADITADGTVIAFRGERAVWMWYRAPGETVADVLGTQPCTAPSPEERQGESIAFDGAGSYATISEGSQPPVHVVRSETDG